MKLETAQNNIHTHAQSVLLSLQDIERACEEIRRAMFKAQATADPMRIPLPSGSDFAASAVRVATALHSLNAICCCWYDDLPEDQQRQLLLTTP